MIGSDLPILASPNPGQEVLLSESCPHLGHLKNISHPSLFPEEGPSCLHLKSLQIDLIQYCHNFSRILLIILSQKNLWSIVKSCANNFNLHWHKKSSLGEIFIVFLKNWNWNMSKNVNIDWQSRNKIVWAAWPLFHWNSFCQTSCHYAGFWTHNLGPTKW